MLCAHSNRWQAAIIRGRLEGKSTKECFQLVRPVTLRDDPPNVNALNTTYISTFATHLYENQVDIFAWSSEPANTFDELLKRSFIRGRSIRVASLSTRVPVTGLVDLEYTNLQHCASDIIKRSKVSCGLKRSHAEAEEDSKEGLTTKRVFRENYEGDAALAVSSYAAMSHPYLYGLPMFGMPSQAHTTDLGSMAHPSNLQSQLYRNPFAYNQPLYPYSEGA